MGRLDTAGLRPRAARTNFSEASPRRRQPAASCDNKRLPLARKHERQRPNTRALGGARTAVSRLANARSGHGMQNGCERSATKGLRRLRPRSSRPPFRTEGSAEVKHTSQRIPLCPSTNLISWGHAEASHKAGQAASGMRRRKKSLTPKGRALPHPQCAGRPLRPRGSPPGCPAPPS